MSIHELEATTDGMAVIVGWDPPLNTFFAQVWNRSLEPDDPAAEVLWVGIAYGEIHDPEQVCDAVAPWAKVPDGLVGKLYGEAHS